MHTSGSLCGAAGLRAYDYTAQAPANANPDTMCWGTDKAGGGSTGNNQHNDVKN